MAGRETKFEEMLEKRGGAGVKFLRCPFLWLPLRLRVLEVAGSGLGHLATCALMLRASGADAIPELGQPGLRRNLHNGRMLAVLVALRRLVVSQGGRRLVSGTWSGRLLRESGL